MSKNKKFKGGAFFSEKLKVWYFKIGKTKKNPEITHYIIKNWKILKITIEFKNKNFLDLVT